jgi:hypothetical protein
MGKKDAASAAIKKQIQQKAANNSTTSTSSSKPIAPVPTGNLISTGLANYTKTTPTLLQAIDVYLVFVMMTGVIQFVYMLLVGIKVSLIVRNVPV